MAIEKKVTMFKTEFFFSYHLYLAPKTNFYKLQLRKSKWLPWSILMWLSLIIISVCRIDQAGKADVRENSSMCFLF